MNRDLRIGNLIGVIWLATVLLSACAAPPTPAATLAPTAAAVPTLAPTATPVPTATPAPTATLIPPTDTPTLPAGITKLSKRPELILAVNKPQRKTSWPTGVVYNMPGTDQAILASELAYYNDLKVDIYYPPNHRFETKLPFVILVHGFQESDEFDKDMQQHIDWAKLIAASGMIAVSAQAGMSPMPNSYHLLEFLSANADVLGLDMTRIGFWICSSQGAPVFKALADKELPYREGFRAAVFMYVTLGVEPSNWPRKLSLFMVKAGGDRIGTNAMMDDFVSKARSNNMPTEYVELAGAPHGFDVFQDTQGSRDVIQKALEFFKAKLLQ